MSDARPHHVVVEIGRARFRTKLRDIEGWLAEWEVDAEIGSVLGSSGLLRVRFADEKAAYAFQRYFADRSAPDEDTANALKADVADENLYDQLARKCPD
ncbi:hypothetical protein OIU35_17705 [Boseaceae bacterium BT-24-1]|nr:hypothetical protein [Boseaceae bacterium BT-24-1]